MGGRLGGQAGCVLDPPTSFFKNKPKSPHSIACLRFWVMIQHGFQVFERLTQDTLDIS